MFLLLKMSGPHTVVLMANEMRCVLEDFYLAMRRKNWFIEVLTSTNHVHISVVPFCSMG